MKIISVRENATYLNESIKYIQSKWASEKNMKMYEDCIIHCINTSKPLPQWYLLIENDQIIGCAGLITNDFISRMDLYPWVCALYIEEPFRGNAYGTILLDRAKRDAKDNGFNNLYLCTDLIGYYERYGFEYLGIGYHPWGDRSRIYEINLKLEKSIT